MPAATPHRISPIIWCWPVSLWRARYVADGGRVTARSSSRPRENPKTARRPPREGAAIREYVRSLLYIRDRARARTRQHRESSLTAAVRFSVLDRTSAELELRALLPARIAPYADIATIAAALSLFSRTAVPRRWGYYMYGRSCLCLPLQAPSRRRLLYM